jgi:hypothetical protein
MPLLTMRQLHEDAPQWVLLFGGLDIMRAKRLLAFYFDETEIDGPSLLNVINVIEDEHGKRRQITLEGLSILDAKAAAATALELKGSCDRAAALVKDVSGEYDKAKLAGKYKGVEEGDWTEHRAWKFGLAKVELGDVENLAACRLESGSSDHCSGTMAAVRAVVAMFMVLVAVVAWLGATAWDGTAAAAKAAYMRCFMSGCQNHFRCIGWGAGQRAVEE